MSDPAPARNDPNLAPFDLKASQFMMPTLVLREFDNVALADFLARQVARMPAFFNQAPIVIDLRDSVRQASQEAIPLVVGMLRGHGMIPVGVRGGSEEQQAQASALEVAVMPATRKKPSTGARSVTESAPKSAVKTLVIDQPVRSGQRVCAEGGDLVLLAGVSSGAEVLAEGNIHAYGALRGRALAGVSGDAKARIFCRELGAEMISIAGRYRVSEDLDNRYLGRAVQVRLDGDALKFELL